MLRTAELYGEEPTEATRTVRLLRRRRAASSLAPPSALARAHAAGFVSPAFSSVTTSTAAVPRNLYKSVYSDELEA